LFIFSQGEEKRLRILHGPDFVSILRRRASGVVVLVAGMSKDRGRQVPWKHRAAFTRGFLFFVAILLTCAGISGCSKVKGIANRATLRPNPVDLNVNIDPTANKNSPVALDIVLIKDKNFWKAAPAMSAKDWFAQKRDLQRRYGKKLQVNSWEWVPGQPIAPITVKVPRWLSGAMVFANYPSPGTHSAPLPLGGKVSISLQTDDFTMETGK
jgi:type VI secretion system protein